MNSLSILRLILVFALTLASSAFAAPRIAILNEETSRVNLGNIADVYIDESRIIDIDLIQSDTFSNRFIPLNNAFPQFGIPKGNIWIRSQLALQSNAVKPAALHINAPRVQKLNIFVPELNLTAPLAELGESRSGSTKPVDHVDFIIPLPDQLPPLFTIYLQIDSHVPVNMTIEAKTLSATFSDAQTTELWTGVILGTTLILLLTNLYFGITLKNKMYLIYSGILVGLGVLHLSIHGYFYHWFPDAIGLQERLYNLSALGCAAAISLFTRSYLNTAITLPSIDRVLLVMGVLDIFLGVGYALFPERLSIIYLSLAATFTLISLFIIAWISVFKKIPYARYYLIARTTLTVGHFIWILSAYALIPTAFWFKWGLTISILSESVIHFVGMIARQRNLYSVGKHAGGYDQEISLGVLKDISKRLVTPLNVTQGITNQLRADLAKQDALGKTHLEIRNLKARIDTLVAIESERTSTNTLPVPLEQIIWKAQSQIRLPNPNSAQPIDFLFDRTVKVDIADKANMIQHLLETLSFEMQLYSSQVLSAYFSVDEKTVLRDGSRLLEIKLAPLPTAYNTEHGGNIGPRHIAHILAHLNATFEEEGVGNKRRATIKIPVSATVSPGQKVVNTQNTLMVFYGSFSVTMDHVMCLSERYVNSVHHSNSLSELLRFIEEANEQNLYLMIFVLEDEVNRHSDVISKVKRYLGKNDQAILVTNNTTISSHYAQKLGFDGIIHEHELDDQLDSYVQRIQKLLA